MELALVALLAALVCSLAIVVRNELGRLRREAGLRDLMRLFAPAMSAVQRDPRELLVWVPIAETGRRLMPDLFAGLDAAVGGRFPFSREDLQAAHARWSAEWLAWERAHDAEYTLKAAAVEDEARRGTGVSSLTRARIEEVEREKLERYQARYEEYVRVSKALTALTAERKG